MICHKFLIEMASPLDVTSCEFLDISLFESFITKNRYLIFPFFPIKYRQMVFLIVFVVVIYSKFNFTCVFFLCASAVLVSLMPTFKGPLSFILTMSHT